MDIVACLLAPWSSGKDPDCYIGIRGNSTDDDVITVANGPQFKSLRKHPESSGPWGCQVRSNVTVWLGCVYSGDLTLSLGPNQNR
jgi:hypothetical protein